MAIISIENMTFYAHHGCFEQERMIGTNFMASIYLTVDTTKAELSDDLQDTIDYSLVYQTIKEQMSIPSKLLEHVARRIILSVKTNFPLVEKVKIKLSKCNPPIGGQMQCVTIELEE